MNSLSLLNQLKYHHSSSSSNGLSSSSSANSNIIEHDHSNLSPQNRHNSHPPHISSTNDEYAFVIKPSKFAHSDGKLDTCLTCNNSPPKNSSWSGLIQYENTHSAYTSSSILSHEPITMIDGLKTLKLKSRADDSPYEQENWYYGSISREEAEHILKFDHVEQGEFLIRNSERRTGSYSLSIRAHDEIIRHFRIESNDDSQRFQIGKRSFQSLYDLIEHYKMHPIYDADPQHKLFLTKPLTINDSNQQF